MDYANEVEQLIALAIMSESEATRSKPVAIAPAPNGGPTPASDDKQTMPYSCLSCARRKVRCDKCGPPCSTCHKTKTECVYEAPPPRKRKRKADEDVYKRLGRYERLLRDHNLIPDGTDSEGLTIIDKDTPKSTKSDQNQAASCSSRGRLVSGAGKTRYIDSALSEILEATGEDMPIFDEEGGTGQPDSSYLRSQDSMSASIFGVTFPMDSLTHLHPTYEAAMWMWRVYVDGVEPIIKILHRPTALSTLQQAATSPSSASRSTECLVFAIYHFAITAMTDQECMEILGEGRPKVLDKYHNALRCALVNADFMRSTNIQVIQAYVMLLLAVRVRYDPNLLWVLTGVAIRMAQRMGLHRDGELIGLNPFDTEIHRRLFWQLPQLDAFAGQLCGTGINIESSSWDTKYALNINDEDIWPGMTGVPKEHKGATEMIFCLTRRELGKFYARTKSHLRELTHPIDKKDLELIEEAEHHIDEVESAIEMNFLRYCDPLDSVHMITSIVSRAAIQASRLRVRLPRAKAGLMDGQEREQLYRSALRIMDHTTATYTNPAFTRFLWHPSTFFVWESLIWVLSELQQGPPTGESETAWSKLAAMCAW